uniref:Uncharacterized protein n=1 Tax=Nitzschia supralitorea TaxID=303403 RepID=A0A8F0WFN8_9STRA|nr:hypothetical protein KYU99_pgp060 [Nitzschia supralitorea]QWM93182.1 hypothetical protein [Nitzschia supralitorea]
MKSQPNKLKKRQRLFKWLNKQVKKFNNNQFYYQYESFYKTGNRILVKITKFRPKKIGNKIVLILVASFYFFLGTPYLLSKSAEVKTITIKFRGSTEKHDEISTFFTNRWKQNQNSVQPVILVSNPTNSGSSSKNSSIIPAATGFTPNSSTRFGNKFQGKPRIKHNDSTVFSPKNLNQQFDYFFKKRPVKLDEKKSNDTINSEGCQPININ